MKFIASHYPFLLLVATVLGVGLIHTETCKADGGSDGGFSGGHKSASIGENLAANICKEKLSESIDLDSDVFKSCVRAGLAEIGNFPSPQKRYALIYKLLTDDNPSDLVLKVRFENILGKQIYSDTDEDGYTHYPDTTEQIARNVIRKECKEVLRKKQSPEMKKIWTESQHQKEQVACLRYQIKLAAGID